MTASKDTSNHTIEAAQVRADSQIHHHALPLTHFLGHQAVAYHRIFNFFNLQELPDYLNQHFNKLVKIPHLQMSKKDCRELTQASRRAIKERYAYDFTIFGDYF